MRRSIQNEIDRFNQNLDRQEKIRRFTLLPRDFTIDDDEITPSLKVKRKMIDKKYKRPHRRDVRGRRRRREGAETGMSTRLMEAPPPKAGATAFRMEREGDLMTVWFDLPGEKVNKFSSHGDDGVLGRRRFDSRARRDIKRVIIASGKPNIFIAGADVSEFSEGHVARAGEGVHELRAADVSSLLETPAGDSRGDQRRCARRRLRAGHQLATTA